MIISSRRDGACQSSSSRSSNKQYEVRVVSWCSSNACRNKENIVKSLS